MPGFSFHSHSVLYLYCVAKLAILCFNILITSKANGYIMSAQNLSATIFNN